MYRKWYTIKLKKMLVVSSRDFRDSQKKYFDLAVKERVVIKRKNEFVELVPRGNNIPENPSPSSDPWFDDPRNIEELERRLKKHESDNKSGDIVLKSKEDIKAFFESLRSMYKIHITKEAKEDISALARSGDKKSIEKLKKILFELQNTPSEGIGQPEQLKYGYSGYWSRKINRKDRLIYRIYEETVTVTVVSAKGHYSDR